MTFLFECIPTGEFIYVNAPDLYHAIETFRAYRDDSDDIKYHIYIKLIDWR